MKIILHLSPSGVALIKLDETEAEAQRLPEIGDLNSGVDATQA